MEDQNNNLEDFLRNSLAKQEATDSDWDKPDPAIWEQAKQKLISKPDAGISFFKRIRQVALILLLLSGVGYIIIQNLQIQTLKAVIDEDAKIESTSTRLPEADKESDSGKMADLVIANNELQAELKKLQDQNLELQEEIRYQYIVAEANQTDFSNETAVPSSPGKHPDAELQISNHLLNEEGIDFAYEYLPPVPLLEIPGKSPDLKLLPIEVPVVNPRRKFEIGYDYSILNMKIPSGNDLNNPKISYSKLETNIYSGATHGVYLAYSPVENIFIRTGLRHTEAKFERTWDAIYDYDKSSEFINEEGQVVNEFSLSIRTPYASGEGEINVEIPFGSNLETGDLFELQISDYQSIRLFQIPLGVDYYFGDGKLQYQVHAGLQWNKMVFESLMFDAKIENKSLEYPVEKATLKFETNSSKQFLGVYVGVGLDYRITSHLSARGGLSYEYSFLNNKSNDFNMTDFFGRAIKIGLNYRF